MLPQKKTKKQDYITKARQLQQPEDPSYVGIIYSPGRAAAREAAQFKFDIPDDTFKLRNNPLFKEERLAKKADELRIEQKAAWLKTKWKGPDRAYRNVFNSKGEVRQKEVIQQSERSKKEKEPENPLSKKRRKPLTFYKIKKPQKIAAPIAAPVAAPIAAPVAAPIAAPVAAPQSLKRRSTLILSLTRPQTRQVTERERPTDVFRLFDITRAEPKPQISRSDFQRCENNCKKTCV
jgi:hypothetical protein